MVGCTHKFQLECRSKKSSNWSWFNYYGKMDSNLLIPLGLSNLETKNHIMWNVIALTILAIGCDNDLGGECRNTFFRNTLCHQMLFSLSTPPKKILHLDNQLLPNTQYILKLQNMIYERPNQYCHACLGSRLLQLYYRGPVILYGTEIASHTLMTYILKTWKLCWECKLLSRSSSSMWI